MSPRQRNINTIQNCEKHFYIWLKARLKEMGVSVDQQQNLSDILLNYEFELDIIKQHLKPLQRWCQIKDECISLTVQLNGKAQSEENLVEMVEKTAIEGQVLWLTLQED
jgi:hypothetical protein